MFMRVLRRHPSPLIAFAILLLGVFWMLTGTVVRGGEGGSDSRTIAEREASRESGIFRVRAARVFSEPRVTTLDLRGRTESRDLVIARSKISGIVDDVYVRKGHIVSVNDILCHIDSTTISTRMEQAETQLAKAQEDYEAAQKLVADGFSTQSQLRSLRSAYFSAVNSMTEAQEAMDRTEIRAEVSGIVQDPVAKVGDNLPPGGTCATLLETDPILFTSQVSERHVNSLRVGQPATISLVDESEFEGELTFIASIADSRTRTFEVEITLSNPDGIIRHGMTASATIPLDDVNAFRLNPSWLVLSDEGTIGVRAIDEDDKVFFRPISILAQDRQAVWVSGLDEGERLIILGQNYVKDTEVVSPVFVESEEALLN